MINKLTILLFFFASVSSYAKNLSKDDVVIREGLYYKKFSNTPFTGKLSGIENGKIKKGKREGQWLIYYEDGALQYNAFFKNGMLDGKYKYYYSNGTLRFEEVYKEGKKNGKNIAYYENGNIEVIKFYSNDLKYGEESIFDPAGNIHFKKNYIKGSLDGEQYAYKDGKVSCIDIFKNKMIMKSTSYFKNGKFIKLYKNNKLHGEQIGYNKDGVWTRRIIYDDGKEIDRIKNKELKVTGITLLSKLPCIKVFE